MSRSRGDSPQQRLVRLAGLGATPGASGTAARVPFVLLIVALLGGGMLALLMLNASLNQGSFRLDELREQHQELTDEQQELQAEVDGYSAPDALARQARELGLVPGGPPAFLAPDGTVRGDPQPAPEPEEDEAADGPRPAPEVEHGPVADDGEEEPDEDADPDVDPEAESANPDGPPDEDSAIESDEDPATQGSGTDQDSAPDGAEEADR